jgi:pimeloyl-ACP methyl ester carboxylesterase
MPTITPGHASDTHLRGELRYGLELARLVADPAFLRPRRRRDSPPVLLIPGFMAGDSSLAVLEGWLRRRGSLTATAGMLFNVGCSERMICGVEDRLRRLAARAGQPVAVIGQSRGGELARVLAVRHPDLVQTVVMLGSPVVNPLHVGPMVLNSVRWVARLGDLGLPWFFSTECGEGECCAAFREDLLGPLPPEVRATSIYSRSDGIVAWQACLDPCATHVEIDSSHCGMSVNRAVYRVLADVLDEDDDPQIDEPDDLRARRAA